MDPKVATAGSSIEITGSNFNSYASEQTVAFVKDGDATEVTTTSRTDSQLTIQVPNALASGQYTIKLSWEQGSTTFDGFSVKEPEALQLTISSISPLSGEVGSTLTIEGTNFSDNVADNKVYFVSEQTSHEAELKSAASASLEVVVPDLKPESYNIKVVVNDKSNFADQSFVVKEPSPVITEISPMETELESIVTVMGENFGTDPDLITIGFTSNGSTIYSHDFELKDGVVKVKLPPNLSAGVYNVHLEANGEEVISSQTLTVTEIATPLVNAIAPNSGRILDKFKIIGSNFGTDISKISVTLQGANANPITVTGITDKIIECEIPNYALDAGDYLIEVTRKGVPATYSVAHDFTILPLEAEVSGMSPSSGTAGTMVTIEGSNFSTRVEDMEVQIAGGLSARIISVNRNEIKAVLPCDLAAGSIGLTLRQVSTNEEIALGDFNVTEPTGTVAYCMSPNPVARGEQMTIYGNNLISSGITNINFVPENAAVGTVFSVPSSTDGGKTLSFKVPKRGHIGTYTVIIQLSSGDVKVNGILEVK
ncbi:hypothetical protein GCM10009122_13130 [Fulvivirga kasyanovii]